MHYCIVICLWTWSTIGAPLILITIVIIMRLPSRIIIINYTIFITRINCDDYTNQGII